MSSARTTRKPASRSTSDRQRTAARRRPAKATRTSGSAGLPGWKELAGRKAGARSKPKPTAASPKTTLRLLMTLFVLGVCVTLFVGHVHATDAVYRDVQRLQQENLTLRLKHNQLRGAFDQATGPQVIHGKAARLGLQEGHAYGPTLIIE
ncbi:MAG: hypothetical protein AAGI08_14795 [Bacteroidota bacterium]